MLVLNEIKYGAHIRLEYTINGDEITMAGYMRKRPCFALKASFNSTNNK